MSQRLNYTHQAPEGMAALSRLYAHVAQAGLGPALVELVYLRASQINGCAFCIDDHAGALIRGGMPVEKLALVPVWRDASELFDAREQAALAWTESVTRVAETGVPQADYDAAAAVFDPVELTELTIAIGLINAYNRLAVSFRATPGAVRALRRAHGPDSPAAPS
jgi:AhpD family alkylhydroperoxidase